MPTQQMVETSNVVLKYSCARHTPSYSEKSTKHPAKARTYATAGWLTEISGNGYAEVQNGTKFIHSLWNQKEMRVKLPHLLRQWDNICIPYEQQRWELFQKLYWHRLVHRSTLNRRRPMNCRRWTTVTLLWPHCSLVKALQDGHPKANMKAAMMKPVEASLWII